jgi:CheY-like chemotaxis protein
VEDDDLFRELVTKILSEAGFQVDQAETGDQAAKLIDVDGYALLLTDINMPGQRDGIEVAAHARSKKPGIPIIFVSARPDSLPTVRSADALTAILPKPFSLEGLFAHRSQSPLSEGLSWLVKSRVDFRTPGMTTAGVSGVCIEIHMWTSGNRGGGPERSLVPWSGRCRSAVHTGSFCRRVARSGPRRERASGRLLVTYVHFEFILMLLNAKSGATCTTKPESDRSRIFHRALILTKRFADSFV